MELTTKIPLQKSNHPIDYHSCIVSFGSCFAENMGEKFLYYKFKNTTNPFGILFHPLAIEKLISFALSEKQFTEEDIFFYMERWHCFDVHSELSHQDKEQFLKKINTALLETKKALLDATHCIITFGTAWVYRHKNTNSVVANCHKVPQNEFEKQLLSVNEIDDSLQKIVESVRKVNPNIHFIFTISPVRHLKDGFVENQRSKAHLTAALHSNLNKKIRVPRLLSEVEAGGGAYFPSFEILMDELRDYRFYAEDMLHPNKVAIDYIWERFTESNIAEEAVKTMTDVENIQKGLAHKPFHSDSTAHKEFLDKLQIKISSLQHKFPGITFP